MLIRELEQQGDWLFRHRSYVPLVLLPLAVIVMATHRTPWSDSLWLERIYELGCLLVSLGGLIMRGLALGYAQSGTSGRNTKEQIADHLNTSGLYAVCRHPLYLGNILMMIGVLLFAKSLLLVIAGLLFYLLFYERIIATEEKFLAGRFGETFSEWAAHTSFLWPHFSRWQKPAQRFSWRAAVKGEFYGFTAVVTAMTLLRHLDIRFTEQEWRLDLVWLVALLASLLAFLILRFLRKRTAIFET
jgi:protein-S-isoprenylcysteine O-methyltransferase Ste14